MQRCETCKYWGLPEETHPDFRMCVNREIDYGGTVYRDRWKDDPESREKKAVLLDGEGFGAELAPRRDFGCILHERKGDDAPL